MNTRKNLQANMRGWFPQQPNYLLRKSPNNDNFKLFTRRMATAVVIGVITAALLAVAGSLLGLDEGIGVYVWSFATIMLINAGVGVYAKYLLRKLGLPAGTKPW
jgi:hypothetical protein